MGMKLVPVEDGIRIEREERLAKEDENRGQRDGKGRQ